MSKLRHPEPSQVLRDYLDCARRVTNGAPCLGRTMVSSGRARIVPSATARHRATGRNRKSPLRRETPPKCVDRPAQLWPTWSVQTDIFAGARSASVRDPSVTSMVEALIAPGL